MIELQGNLQTEPGLQTCIFLYFTPFMIRVILFLLIGLSSFAPPKVSFKKTQLKYARVKAAYESKEKTVQALYKKHDLNLRNSSIFIRVFKQENELELWAKELNSTRFKKVKTFAICAKSGTLGPKKMAGDGQVPEGLYTIDRFNPVSNYHLSLGINYPNKADKIRAGFFPPGGDIFIHGECVTIGCMPLTNEFIEELYIACIEAKESQQKEIKVEIYPCKLNTQNISVLKKQYAKNNVNLKLWSALQKSYQYFEKNYFPAKYSIDAKGNYLVID